MEGTLQDRALLKATEHIASLKGLLAFCAKNPRISDSCDKSAFFWRESLMHLFGKTLVLQRGDLTDDDWPLFAKILATGRVFQYAMREDMVDGTTGPEPYYNIFGGVWNIADMFTIPVAVPLPGTTGHFVRWKFDGTQARDMISFFVGSDTTLTLKLASEWVALEYYNYHMDTLEIRGRFQRLVDFFRDEDYHDDTGVRKEMPIASVLNQLVIERPMLPNGSKSDTWFSYYGRFDHVNFSGERYSESNYRIVPITF